MAKRSKKQIRKVTRSTDADRANAASSASSIAIGSTNRASSTDFNPDYSQTIKDLKRIGVLASTFFVVLVVISFFLR